MYLFMCSFAANFVIRHMHAAGGRRDLAKVSFQSIHVFLPFLLISFALLLP